MFDKLKEIRREHGDTCDVMAKLLSLKTKGAYNKKENGDVPFTLDEAIIVSNYFNKKIDEIFFNNEVSIMETKEEIS